METNKIVIELPKINNNRIDYLYEVSGEWKEVFKTEENFFVEYSQDISQVPLGIAIIPLIANILPIAWIFDAEIIMPVCDKAFYDSIPEFKKGYSEMYPMIQFKGKITVENIQENHSERNGLSGAFFSGGVDAFNTLICHVDEKPALITLWGSDVKLDDTEGWKKVETHISNTANDFGIDFMTVKSSFRYFFKEWKLDEKVKESGDGWWHGFQHGIGIISHAAPIAFLNGMDTLYFASSFTIADKGKVTCASDPTIDNFVRYGDTCIIHDGYEFNRQMKVHNIVEYVKKYNKKIPLRVCWESKGGANCCSCEKCWRTMLSIYAENSNPNDFDFIFSDDGLKKISNKMRYERYVSFRKAVYKTIQNDMHRNFNKANLPKEIQWFYSIDLDKLGNPSIFGKVRNRVVRVFMKK